VRAGTAPPVRHVCVSRNWQHRRVDSPSIRPADGADLPTLERIARAAYAPYVERIGREPAPMTVDYRAVVGSGHCWVATNGVDDTVLGFVVLVPMGDHLLVENVAVDPAAQGGGVGRALLDHAEDRARAEGLGELRLYTNEAMRENLSYYPRRGYVETGRRVEDGFRRVFFAKDLSASDRGRSS
jgi:ribosomal protein S18 acetylase RimI-like enzyme